MLKVGITGGIGSGKTTISRILENLGVPVFNSDEVGRRILNEDEQVKQEVMEVFDKDMYNSKGELDRERMASVVFNDPRALNRLSAIVHPKVKQAFDEFCEEHQNAAYVVKEAAILFESGNYHDLDKIVSVFAPKEDRIKRVMKRDGVSEENVKRRMIFQYSDEERNELADFILMNEQGVDLLPEVMELHEIILNEKQ
jgi:dephospho-CoA kinase